MQLKFTPKIQNITKKIEYNVYRYVRTIYYHHECMIFLDLVHFIWNWLFLYCPFYDTTKSWNFAKFWASLFWFILALFQSLIFSIVTHSFVVVDDDNIDYEKIVLWWRHFLLLILLYLLSSFLCHIIYSCSWHITLSLIIILPCSNPWWFNLFRSRVYVPLYLHHDYSFWIDHE